jgi:tRNA threonylcarbamoyladenosine modification (KEOPS) complex  Pcc1 subunit
MDLELGKPMTIPWFEVDMAENDRLLLEEAQRRQDLIDFAVRRFAPHFEADPDVKVIHLYSTNTSLCKEIRSHCGGKTILVEHVLTESKRRDRNEMLTQRDGLKLAIPSTADLVATKSALNSKIQWLSAQLRALPLVLPEATEYLLAYLDKRRVLIIVGGDQA